MGLLDVQPNIIDPTLENKVFLFYGETGTRKTTVAASFPHHIIAATEHGYKFINGAMAQPITKWADMLAFYRDLKDPEVQEKFSTVVFDRADTLYEYCYDYVCAAQGVKSPTEKGFGIVWDAIKREFLKVINGIEGLGYGMVFICHDKDLLNTKMEYVGTKVDIKGQALTIIKGLSDFIFMLKKEPREDGVETVFAYSNLTDIETKSRARYFAPRFEFTYDNLVAEMKNAIDTQVKIEGIQTAVRDRPHTNDRPFEEIKQSVLEKLNHMQETEDARLEDAIQMATIQTQGHKISELNETYYNQLLTIETYLIGLELE